MDVATAPIKPQNGSVEALVRLAAADMGGVDALITARLDSPVPVIPALAEHLIAAGGKRLRPLLTVAAARLAGGTDDACLKLTRAHDLNLDQHTYLEIIRAKTAELFAASAEAGAVSAGASEAQIAALRAYGLNLGLAFQLADDALDYSGVAETLGKNAGDDFREGKATLPLLLAIARSGPREAEFWERAIGRLDQTEADFRRAREIIVGTGALQATLDLGTDYAETAKAALAVFPDGEWRRSLEALADFAVSRPA